MRPGPPTQNPRGKCWWNPVQGVYNIYSGGAVAYTYSRKKWSILNIRATSLSSHTGGRFDSYFFFLKALLENSPMPNSISSERDHARKLFPLGIFTTTPEVRWGKPCFRFTDGVLFAPTSLTCRASGCNGIQPPGAQDWFFLPLRPRDSTSIRRQRLTRDRVIGPLRVISPLEASTTEFAI